MSSFEQQAAALSEWFASSRFKGITRLHTARDVIEQRGTVDQDYTVARSAAAAFYARLRELFEGRKSITTFGPYSPGHAVAMKRMGIEGIYLGGWATSAKGSINEDPGPDLASYPLSQVPDEAASLVRALLSADRNQHFARSRMTQEQRDGAPPPVDFQPFVIADADTGHGGDAHVRNLVRRFVEVGVPGYHIEDQRPGAKKCGHQAGKVLVGSDEQIKRLNAARFQLDVMGVEGIIVARTDAEAATFLDNRSDERDHPFILGATNLDLPSYKTGYLAILRSLFELGVDALRGHLLYKVSEEEYSKAFQWLDQAGLSPKTDDSVREALDSGSAKLVEAALDRLETRYMEFWRAEAGLKTYGQAVADAMEQAKSEGKDISMGADEWNQFAKGASHYEVRAKALAMELEVSWDCEHAKTSDGFYQIQGGIEYAITKSLAAAPFADLLWMETKTADLEDAREFAEAIHAVFPDQMLAYNLSPSFSWDTTGMTDEEMTQFPEELGKLGFTFNFITYGGHQIDGLAAEEFSTALREEGMLALAKLQRKFRLLESPYRTPQTLVGGPRLDAMLMASSGRTAATKAMGKGSTQHQHLVQTEVSPELLEEWLGIWKEHHGLEHPMRVALRPHTSGSELLELKVLGDEGVEVAAVVFGEMQDRRGRNIISISNQGTVPALQRKRLMTLVQLFLVHRYEADAVHYVTPTEDNENLARGMERAGILSHVYTEVGSIIVADVDADRVEALLQPDHAELKKLIQRARQTT